MGRDDGVAGEEVDDATVERSRQECFRYFDTLTPDKFAREFVRAENNRRIIFQIYMRDISEERRELIKQRVGYYSTPEGNAELDTNS